MTRCAKWNEDANILAAFQENGKLMVWLHPQVAFVDRGLLPLSTCEKDPAEFGAGKGSLQLAGFQENQISVRRSDGSLVSTSINAFAVLLHTYASQGHWTEALRLCRYLKDSSESGALWAAFAGMALQSRQLEVSEQAYAAINRVEKVFFLQRIQEIGDKEARKAEIALLCGNIREAESLCLHNGFLLRAVMLNVELHKWTRAAELATKFDKSQRYLSVVFGHRQRFLDKLQRSEDNKQLQALFNEVSRVRDIYHR